MCLQDVGLKMIKFDDSLRVLSFMKIPHRHFEKQSLNLKYFYDILRKTIPRGRAAEALLVARNAENSFWRCREINENELREK